MMDNISKRVLFQLCLLVATFFHTVVCEGPINKTSPGVSMSLELSLINQFKNTHMNTIV
jgi:hypothetical protein